MANHENNSRSAHSTAVLEESGFVITEPTAELTETDLLPRKAMRVRRSLQRHPWKVTAALILAVAVLIGCGYFARQAYLYEGTDDAQINGHVMPVSARINGHVVEVRVIEGQLVHAGDVLAVIDPEDYRIAVAQARASLADAQAISSGSRMNVPITSVAVHSSLESAQTAVANAEAGVKAAERNYASANATVEQMEAYVERSDVDLVRYQQLVAKENVSRQQYDQAVAAAKANRALLVASKASAQSAEQAWRQAQGKLAQAKADLQTAETAPQQVSVTRSRADAAEAQALQRKAQLDQAELNLSYAIIRSPVTGIVGKKSVEVGENVGIGQELMSVVPLDDIWVTANFKELQLKRMLPGQAVEIKIDAYGHSWKGHVTNIGAGTGSVFSLLPPENATGNYVKVVQRVPVRIDFDRVPGQEFNAEGLLKPGLSVEPDVRVR